MEKIEKAKASLTQFAAIFASLQLRLEEHKILTASIDELNALLTEFDQSGDWAKRYNEQTAELITTSIDAGVEKTITL